MTTDRKEFSLDSPEALHEWAAAHNLNEIVNFHNIVRALLSEKAAAFGDDAIDDIIAKSHLRNFAAHLASATFLMVYAYLEEDLYLLKKWHAPDVKLDRGHSIPRYAPVLTRLGFDLKHSSWQFMAEATDIRHCLIHANGRVDHNRNRQRLEEIVAKYPGELTVVHSRLGVTVEFVSRYIEQVHSFQDETRRVRLARESQNDSELAL